MSVVDFHAHFFSRVFFETLAAQSAQPGTVEERLARVVAKTGIELPSADVAVHTARWIGELDRHGVDHMCAFASVPEEIPVLAQAGALSKGRITPFALVNPTVAGVADKVRVLLAEKGFRGVLLFPALHHFHIGGPEAEPLLAVLEQHRAIAYVHCGALVVKLRDLLGVPTPADVSFANPLALVAPARAHPNVRFVIPHFGAGLLRETLFAGRSAPNIFVDTSSSNSWAATHEPKLTLLEVFRHALEEFTPQRILFGTDSNVFPAGWRADRRDEQLAVLRDLRLAPADIEAITAGNARRLLALT